MTPIFIISGPSGAGEDSVIEGLKEKIDYARVVTTVTRPKRSGESEGKPYYFVSRDTFERMKFKDEFIECAVVYGDYRGATKKELDRLLIGTKPIIWKVDWQGVKTIKQKYPEAVSIFIVPPSYEALEARLRHRGDSREEVARRKGFTIEWLEQKSVYDHIVVNEDGKLDETILTVAKIITEHHN